MFEMFGWLFFGIDFTMKLIWILILPVRMISWISNILVNLIFLGIVCGVIALATGHVPDSLVQSSMDNIGKKALHYIDPNGEKVNHIVNKQSTSTNLITPQ